MPYYDNVLDYRRSSGRLLPLDVARQAIRALEKVYDAGYALVDASIDNLLVDRREGLKLIDFEFCHRYERRPESFSGSYDIAGCPADFLGDLPIQGGNSYDRNWRPYIGLSLDALMHDPNWLAHLKARALLPGTCASLRSAIAAQLRAAMDRHAPRGWDVASRERWRHHRRIAAAILRPSSRGLMLRPPA